MVKENKPRPAVFSEYLNRLFKKNGKWKSVDCPFPEGLGVLQCWRLKMAVVFFGEVFEGFLDHLLVIGLVEFLIRFSPELLTLFVVQRKRATAAAVGLAAVGLPVPKFVFIVPGSVFRHAWQSLLS